MRRTPRPEYGAAAMCPGSAGPVPAEAMPPLVAPPGAAGA